MQETLGRRMTVGYGVVLVLLGVIVLASYRSTTQSLKDARRVSYTHVVLERLTSLLLEAETLEGKQRSYLLTGEEQFRHAALAAVPAIQQMLQEISTLTKDNPRQQERLGAVKALVEARLALAANIIEIYRRNGFAAAQQKVQMGEGSRLAESVKQGVREMESEEHTLLATREVAASTSAHRTIWVILLSGLSSLLVVLVAGRQVRRELGARLHADTALRQSHKELEHRVRERTTELARTNEQLQMEIDQRGQAEEQFYEFFEGAPDAMVIVNREGVIVAVNMQIEQMFGYARAELVGRAVEILLPPHFRHRHPVYREDYMTAPYLRPMGTNLSLYALRKDGSEFPVEVLLNPLKEEEYGLVASSIRDISEIKRAEEQLRSSLARLQLLAETSQAFAEVGLEVQPLLDLIVQKTAEAISDVCFLHLLSDDEQFLRVEAVYTVDAEVLTFVRGEMLHHSSRTDEAPMLRQLLRSGQPLFRPVINMEDLRAAVHPQYRAVVERLKLHSLMSVPMRVQGRMLGMLVLSRYRREQVAFTEEDLRLAQDLADRAALAIANVRLYHNLQQELVERGRTEQRMQQQLGRLALLHELTRAIGERQDLASIFLTVVGRLESELPASLAAVLLGHPQEAQLQVHTVGPASRALAGELALTEQGTIPVDLNGLQRTLAGQTVSEPDTAQVPFPFPQRLAQGGLRALVLTPLQTKAEVFGVLVVARREVGSFSSGECEFLRQLSEHVALAVRQIQLSSEVQLAYDELRQTQHLLVQQERLRALGQLASGIAHDINNAITPASLYVEDVLQREALSPEGRDSLTTVQTAIKDVAQTVARLREFYRKAESSEELVPMDLNRVVRQSVNLTRARWRDQAQRQGIDIRLETRLVEELPSVSGNESEVREMLINLILNAVDAMPHGGTLTIATQATPTAVEVAVQDTGVGMDGETKQRCIEPFYTTKGERGTGLGLAMVYGIVQRHGGELEISSEVGEGTTMRVQLPYVAVAEGEPVAVAGGEREVPVLRILVIDDEPLIRKSVGEVLRRWGHEVLTAGSGEEGVAVFRRAGEEAEKVDVVITDLGMPKMDGMEVARRIKEMEGQTPVIMLTGWGQQLSPTAERTPHVDVLLSKPPQLTDLRSALETVTGNGRKKEDRPV